MSPLHVLVTRPREQAQRWVRELASFGVKAHALPLIDIGEAADAAPVVQAWQGIASQALVMFVSANAVRQFFALKPAHVTWPQALRAASTGPGTTAALREAGVASAHIVAPADDGPYESEALWQRLVHEPWQGAQVLVVRGEQGRDWLAQQWREKGATVHFVNAYRRMLPQWQDADAQRCDEAIAKPDTTLWLFSSSEAVANLRRLRPGANLAAGQALCTHERIAETARAIGFVQVHSVAPRAADVAAVAATLAQGPSAGPSVESPAL